MGQRQPAAVLLPAHGNNLTTDTQRIIRRAARSRRMPQGQAASDAAGHRRDSVPAQFRLHARCVERRRSAASRCWSAIFRSACSSDMFDHVVVTCDNPESRGYGAQFDDPRLRFMLRDPRQHDPLRQHRADLEMIAASSIRQLRGITVVALHPVALRDDRDLEEAVSTLAMSEADSANGVEEITTRCSAGPRTASRCSTAPASCAPISTRSIATCRPAWRPATAIFPTGSLIGRSMVSFVVSAAECFFIDSEHKMKTGPADGRQRPDEARVSIGIVVAARTSSSAAAGQGAAAAAGAADDRFPVAPVAGPSIRTWLFSRPPICRWMTRWRRWCAGRIRRLSRSQDDLVARYVGAAKHFGFDTVGAGDGRLPVRRRGVGGLVRRRVPQSSITSISRPRKASFRSGSTSRYIAPRRWRCSMRRRHFRSCIASI